jgi:hypothetical protein
VSQIVVDGAGWVYGISSEDNDALALWAPGGRPWTVLDWGVRQIAVDGAGLIYETNSNNGALVRWGLRGGSSTVLDWGVSSIAADSAGSVWELRNDGHLYHWAPAAAAGSLIDSGVTSFFPAPNGESYFEVKAGVLNRFTYGSGWSVLDIGVTSFAFAPDGESYFYLTNGTLKQFSYTTGWSVLDTGVTSFVLGVGDNSIDVLEANGNLWQYAQYTSSSRTLLDQNVQSIWLDSWGYTLFALGKDGTLQEFRA